MSQNRDLGYKSLENDPRVQASIRRLKAMGLKFETTAIDKDTIAIGFDIEALLDTLREHYTLILHIQTNTCLLIETSMY